MKTIIIFLSLLMTTTVLAAEHKIPCLATETTPCVKRSDVHWCWRPVESPDECWQEGWQSIVIFKDDGENPKKYCIRVEQYGVKTKIYAESSEWIPGEIVRDMFCSVYE